MSVWKFLLYFVIFIGVFFLFLFLRYGNETASLLSSILQSSATVPFESQPTFYGTNESTSTTSPSSEELGMHPLLFPNMRWAYMPVKIYVDNSTCTSDIYTKMSMAAEDWAQATNGTVSFSFDGDPGTANVNVECNRHLPTQEEGNMVVETLGETQPKALDSGLYNVTQSADVSILLHQYLCHQPIVFIHELGHVLGLAHDNDTESVMYPYERCNQKITPQIVSTLKALYADPALPDLYLKDVSANRHGIYVDFNLTILNRGIIDSPTTTISIVDGSNPIYSLDVPILRPGSGWYYTVGNVLVRSSFANVSVKVDPKNEIKELTNSSKIIYLVQK